MMFLGIDPGKSGGIALLRPDGTVALAVPLPETERDLLDLLTDLDRFSGPDDCGPLWAVVERASASPQMGTVSAFTFGRGYGAIFMALTAAAISFDVVGARTWQPVMGVVYPGRAKQGARDKNVSKRRAQQLFPWVTVTHAIADALLIAEYCRRVTPQQQRREAIE